MRRLSKHHVGRRPINLLATAVVDVITLVAACHALKSSPAEGEAVLQRQDRRRLRRDLKRGTVAYIDALARTRRGVVDDAVLAKCRIAAESQMPHALAHQEALRLVMAREAGSLNGLAAERQDLWRLAHMAIHLSGGMALLRASGGLVATKSAEALADRLRRRFRRALIAYAKEALRSEAGPGGLVLDARAAALAEIRADGSAQAQRLADLEAGASSALTLLRLGVTKPLLDLAHDWHRREPKNTD